MARRKKKEDAFDSLVAAPAGVSFVIGIVALFVIQGIPCPASFRTLLYFIPGMIFFASFISLIKGLQRNMLHEKTKTLEDIRNMSWREFETFVGEVFRRQGYSVEETGGGGADGGIDLILRSGSEKMLVQCKQWRTFQVGVKIVREMYGLLMAEDADRVFIVSVGSYTKDAAEFARGKPIELIDGDKLVKLRNEQGAGHEFSYTAATPAPQKSLSVATSIPQKSPSCPRCNSQMVLRTAKKGANAGNQFWGCSRYPECKGIVNG
jgi:restriction system protein